ncbi:MAG: DUF4337 domain-containing protein [Pseudolabrys sp.]|nr:DUF4337 domain-containing protein [Pseudolabrys sp.]MSP31347.1 DUF4337 domain-containing protein [Pseudolabrys sp.]
MDADIKTESSNKRLNDLVAVSVVILSVFMAVSKIKDDNINQAMQKAKAESVDAWTEYQAARIKLHVDENGLAQLRLLETAGNFDRALAAKQAAEFEADIKKYVARSKETRTKAESLEKEYDRLNFRDDQFDMSDAFTSIAIALAAVAALVDSYWLLYVAWGSGALGMIFGFAGFAGLNFRPEWLAQLLGT